MKSGHTVGDGCPGHVAICEKYKLPMLHETVAEEVWTAVGWTIGTRRNAVFGATETSNESGEVQKRVTDEDVE